MKTVLALVSFVFFAQTAVAAGGTRQDIVRKSISGEILSVKPLCPTNAVCVTDGTVLEVQFLPQSACSDITVKYEQDEKSQLVNITAVEAINVKEACIAVLPEPKIETISLVMMFPPFVVNFVGTDVSYEILPEDVDYN